MLIPNSGNIRDALAIIDANAQGTGFVINDDQKLVGVVTDGDIRRAFINQGKTLETPVVEVMQTQFTSYPVTTSPDEINASLSDRIRHIPLLDESGKVVDYASRTRLHRIPIMEPLLGGNELAYVSECVRTNWISSQGRFVRDFERMMGEFHGMPYALAVSNGTVALHLALDALGVGEGDEVIVPNLTFAASINSIIYAGATPVIVDVDDTWSISTEAIRAAITPHTKAIMPVHLYGYPCDMHRIEAIAREHNLLVIEDNAEGLGTTLNGQLTATFGDAATFSFFGNKTVTTGEGGMIFFKNKKHYEHAAVLRDHGMSKTKKYWHNYVGYNYRMTNLQAAIGVAQMERIDDILNKKCTVGKVYNELLADVNELILPPHSSEVRNTYWLYTLLVNDKKTNLSRDEIIKKLLQNGIEARPVFFPLHVMPPYVNFAKGEYPNTDYISRQGLSLPSSVGLTEEQQGDVCRALKGVFKVRELLKG